MFACSSLPACLCSVASIIHNDDDFHWHLDAQAYFTLLILKDMGWSSANALLLVSLIPQEE
jgi:hypothetical protein